MVRTARAPAAGRAADNDDVDVKVIEVRRGRDGKCYPSPMPTPKAERNRLRWLAHNLCCRDKLSIRAAQRVMLSQYAVRRSRGQIHKDLLNFCCGPRCVSAEKP